MVQLWAYLHANSNMEKSSKSIDLERIRSVAVVEKELSLRTGYFLTKNVKPDVKLKGIKGIEHPVHWVALASAIEYFTCEKTDVVLVDTDNEAAVEFIVNWLYSSEFPKYTPTDVLNEVSRIANIWNSDELEQDVEFYFKRTKEAVREATKVLDFGKAVALGAEVTRCSAFELQKELRRWNFYIQDGFLPYFFEGEVSEIGQWAIDVFLSAIERRVKHYHDTKFADSKFRGTNKRVLNLKNLQIVAKSTGSVYYSFRELWIQSPIYAETLKNEEVTKIEIDGDGAAVQSAVQLMNGEELPPQASNSFQRLYEFTFQQKLLPLLEYLELMVGVVHSTIDMLEWSAQYPSRPLGRAIVMNMKRPSLDQITQRKTFVSVKHRFRSDTVVRRCLGVVETVVCLALVLYTSSEKWKMLRSVKDLGPYIICIKENGTKYYIA